LPKGGEKRKKERKQNDKKYQKRRTKRDVQVVQKLWPKSKPKANSKKYIDGMLWGRGQHWLAFGRAYDIIYGLLFVQKVCKKICCDSFIIFLFPQRGDGGKKQKFQGTQKSVKI